MITNTHYIPTHYVLVNNFSCKKEPTNLHGYFFQYTFIQTHLYSDQRFIPIVSTFFVDFQVEDQDSKKSISL